MSLSVLVVEDSVVNQTLVRAILINAGHTVRLANNGREAVAMIEAETFDFVLMDVQMPEMDGLTATRLIRQSEEATGRRLPIVALTASEERGPCMEAGMDDFMTKPVRAVELLEIVRQIGCSQEETLNYAEPRDAAKIGPVSVLLVEDSPTAKLLVPKLLEKGIGGPYSLDINSTLASARERIKQGGIDVVLLDLNLDDSAGLDTLRSVRELDSNVPIIVLTGEADETLSVTAIRSGAQDYLVKWRFNSDSLTRAIQFTLERHKWASEKTSAATSNDSHRQYVARAIQKDLLPTESPKIAGVDLHGRCEIAHTMDGDFFDYLPMPGDSVGIAVGSVAAPGLRAVMKMVEARAVIRSLVLTHGDVGYICSRAAEVITRDLQLGERINMAFTRVDPEKRSIQYVAGDGQGLLLESRAKVKHQLRSSAPPICQESDVKMPEAKSINVDPGDILVLASRPLADFRSTGGDRVTLENLVKSIAEDRETPAQVMVEMLFQKLYQLGGDHPLDHDISFVVARFNDKSN